MTPSAVLRAARERIERGWCQGAPALDPDGGHVLGDDPSACAWCVLGALAAGEATTDTVGDDGLAYTGAVEALKAVLDVRYLAAWNDARCRTQAEVLDAFRKAIELAERQERGE